MFANYLQLDHLDEEAARAAINGPIDYRRDHETDGKTPVAIQAELIETVLRQVQRDDGGPDARFEAPYLQLVMERLWDQDAESGELKLDTLTKLGGAGTIVRAHLADALGKLTDAQRAAAAAAFRFLVTSSGSKIALTADELAELARTPREELDPALERLDHARVLRRAAVVGGEPRYELFHDVLGAAVIEWRKHYEAEAEAHQLAEKLEAEEKRHLEAERSRHAAQLRRVVGLAVGVLCLLVVGGLAIAAVIAMRERGATRSRALAAASLTQSDVDAELSLVLAREGWKEQENERTEEAMRLALSSSRALGQLPSLNSARPAVGSDENGRYIGMIAGDVARVWDGSSGRWVPGGPLKPGGVATTVAWDNNAQTLVVSGRGGVLVQRRGKRPQRLTTQATSWLELSSDGSLMIAGLDKRISVFDVRTGQVLASLEQPLGVEKAVFVSKRDERIVFSTCKSGDVQLWDWRAQRVDILRRRGSRSTHAPLRNSITACSFAVSADGKQIATAGASEAIRLWSTATRRFVRELAGYSVVRDLRFAPRGRSLVAIASDGAEVYGEGSEYSTTLTPPREVPSLELGGQIAGGAHITAVEFSDDAQHIAVGNGDGTIAIDDVRSGAKLFTLDGHVDSINSLDFLTGDRLVSSADDSTVRLWNVRTPANLIPADEELQGIVAATYRRDGKAVAFAGANGTVYVLRAGERKARPFKHGRRVHRRRGVSARRPIARRLGQAGISGRQVLHAQPCGRSYH